MERFTCEGALLLGLEAGVCLVSFALGSSVLSFVYFCLFAAKSGKIRTTFLLHAANIFVYWDFPSVCFLGGFLSFLFSIYFINSIYISGCSKTRGCTLGIFFLASSAGKGLQLSSLPFYPHFHIGLHFVLECVFTAH